MLCEKTDVGTVEAGWRISADDAVKVNGRQILSSIEVKLLIGKANINDDLVRIGLVFEGKQAEV